MLYFLFLMGCIMVACYKSIKNKPLAIIVVVSCFFCFVLINKKNNTYYTNTSSSQYSNHHKHANNTHSQPATNHYDYDSQCTAICYDGTCSKSLGRRGVCSSHGGVKHWLR